MYDVQEEFDAEMFDEDHDPTGLKKLRVRKEMECAISENAHLAHDWSNLFAFIWKRIIPDSQELIRQWCAKHEDTIVKGEDETDPDAKKRTFL